MFLNSNLVYEWEGLHADAEGIPLEPMNAQGVYWCDWKLLLKTKASPVLSKRTALNIVEAFQ